MVLFLTIYLSLFSTPLRESHVGEFNSNENLLTIKYRYEIHLLCKYQKLTIVLRSPMLLHIIIIIVQRSENS